MKTLSVVIIYLAGLGFACQSAPLFGLLTFVTSFLVFSKIESDQNVYDLGFWFTRTPGAGLLFWFRAFGKLEAVIRSILLGFLAWFTFAGTNEARILESTWLLCIAVFGSYFLLAALVRTAHLNVLRWAFVKFSVILGIIFSTISVIFRTPRRSVLESVGGWLNQKLPWRNEEISVDQKVDQAHVVMNDAAELIHEKLDGLTGEPVASIVMVLFNTQILQGFLVVLFTFLLLLLTIPELRRRPEARETETAS